MHQKLDGAMHHRERCRDDRDETLRPGGFLRFVGHLDVALARAEISDRCDMAFRVTERFHHGRRPIAVRTASKYYRVCSPLRARDRPLANLCQWSHGKLPDQVRTEPLTSTYHAAVTPLRRTLGMRSAMKFWRFGRDPRARPRCVSQSETFRDGWTARLSRRAQGARR